MALAAAYAAGGEPPPASFAPQHQQQQQQGQRKPGGPPFRRQQPQKHAMDEEYEAMEGELPNIDDMEVAAAAAGVAPVPAVLAELGYFELGKLPPQETQMEQNGGQEDDGGSSDEGAGHADGASTP